MGLLVSTLAVLNVGGKNSPRHLTSSHVGYSSSRVASDLNMDSAPGDLALPTAAAAALLSQTMMELALLLSPSQTLAELLLLPPSTPMSLDFSCLSA